MPFNDLREFIGFLESKGELIRTKKPVDVKYEISAYIRKTSDVQGPALLFDNVKEFTIPVLGGAFATRKRALLALETSNEDYVNKFHDALDHLVAPKLTANAPCKDVIIKGQDVDLNKLPVPIFSERDPAPFITLGLCISRDPKSGGKNTSIYRLQLKGRNRLGIMKPRPKAFSLPALPKSTSMSPPVK